MSLPLFSLSKLPEEGFPFSLLHVIGPDALSLRSPAPLPTTAHRCHPHWKGHLDFSILQVEV